MAKAVTKIDDEQATTLPAVTTGAGLPDFVAGDVEEFAGWGTSQRSEDNVIPWLVLLQKGSPQVNKKDAKYINGADAGMAWQKATNELFNAENEPLEVIPVFYTHKMVEWTPRGAAGGTGAPAATHELDTLLKNRATPNEKGALVLPNGNELHETVYQFMLVKRHDGSWMRVVCSMSSSSLGSWKRWNTVMNQFTTKTLAGPVVLPSFHRIYKLRTVWAQNEKGDWYNWVAEDGGPITDRDTYEMAKLFAVSLKTGKAKAAEEGDNPTSNNNAIDDNIPI